MSIKVMSEVWDDKTINSRAELLVMLTLADHARDDGICWPSIDTIASKARATSRGIYKIISRLERLGKISIDSGAGEHSTNVYRVYPTPERRSPLNPDANTPLNGLDQKKNQPVHPIRKELSGTVIREEPPIVPQGSVVIPNVLNNEKFLAAWDEWKLYRGNKLKPQTQKKQLDTLSLMSSEFAIATIMRSIEHGWMGLFPEKEPQNKYDAVDDRGRSLWIRRGGKMVLRSSIESNI
jgi:hypothetical protein